MSSRDAVFLVNERLVGVTTLDLLKQRNLGGLAAVKPGAEPATPPAAPDLPLLSGASWPAGTVLTGARDAANAWYLPAWRLATDPEGRPAVKLEWEGGTDAASPRVGTLDLALTWTPPALPAGARELRLVDHVSTVHLEWETRVGGGPGMKQEAALGALSPRSADRVGLVYEIPDAETFLRLRLAMSRADAGARLVVRSEVKVGRRTWKQVLVGKARSSDVLLSADAVTTSLTAKATLDATSRATISAAARAGLFDRIRRVGTVTTKPTTPAEPATPAEPIVATPIVATPILTHTLTMPITPIVAEVKPVTPVAEVKPVSIDASVLARVRLGHLANLHRVAPTDATPAEPAPAEPATPAEPAPAEPVPTLSRVAFSNAATLSAIASARVLLSSDAASTAATQALSGKAMLSLVARTYVPDKTLAVKTSDLVVAGRQALPTKAVVDLDGAPAIIETAHAITQAVPFTFDPAHQAGVYARDPGNLDLDRAFLRAVPLLVAGQVRATVYEDLVDTGAIYYVPREWRLTRDAAPPHLPGLLFAFAEVLVEGEGASSTDVAATATYRVHVGFRTEPVIDPTLPELVRASFGPGARLLPARPLSATIALEPPGGAPAARALALESLDGELADGFELDPAGFEALLGQLAGGGFTAGRVSFRIFDEPERSCPIVLGLGGRRTGVLDAWYLGPDAAGAGQHRVRLRNPTPATLTVKDVPGFPIPGGVARVAGAVEGALQERVLAPGASFDVVCAVEPADLPVYALRPPIEVEIAEDATTVLAKLCATEGVEADETTIEVTTDAAAFGAGPGGEPLEALIVEFDDGTRAVLTAAAPSTRVTLLQRLLLRVLRHPDADRFLYRVTNVLPGGREDARSSWGEHRGGGTLLVGPVRTA